MFATSSTGSSIVSKMSLQHTTIRLLPPLRLVQSTIASTLQKSSWHSTQQYYSCKTTVSSDAKLHAWIYTSNTRLLWYALLESRPYPALQFFVQRRLPLCCFGYLPTALVTRTYAAYKIPLKYADSYDLLSKIYDHIVHFHYATRFRKELDNPGSVLMGTELQARLTRRAHVCLFMYFSIEISNLFMFSSRRSGSIG